MAKVRSSVVAAGRGLAVLTTIGGGPGGGGPGGGGSNDWPAESQAGESQVGGVGGGGSNEPEVDERLPIHWVPSQ